MATKEKPVQLDAGAPPASVPDSKDPAQISGEGLRRSLDEEVDSAVAEVLRLETELRQARVRERRARAARAERR